MDGQKKKAESARINFGLNKSRQLLDDSVRKAKYRVFQRKQCPLSHCQKEVLRLGNHLRQYHKVPAEKVLKLVNKASDVLPSTLNEESESTESSDDEEELPTQVRKLYDAEILRRGLQVYDDSDSDDPDWLFTNYLDSNVIKKTNIENFPMNNFSRAHNAASNTACPAADDISSSNDNDAACVSESNISCSNIADEDRSTAQIEDADFEDLEEPFYMTSTEEDAMLDRFVSWMTNVDGGFKPLRTAKQQRSVLVGILRHQNDVGPLDFSNLESKPFLEGWMTANGNKSPGTLKTYLGSVLCFFDFCEINNENVVRPDKIQRIRNIIKKWRRTLQKKIEIRGHEKNLEDLARLPTSEDMVQFDQSELVESTKLMFKKVRCEERNLLRNEFCRLRDYLVTVLIIDNASRSGAIANMTIHEYKQVKVGQDGGYLINVKKHKTAYKGPAIITMDCEVFQHLQIYVEKARNRLPGISKKSADTVFVSWTGRAMESSMITQQFQSFWGQALNRPVSINTTIIRKFATTTVYEHAPELKAATANLLCHSEKTAERSYHLLDKQKKAFATSCNVKSAMRTNYNLLANKEELNTIFGKEIERKEISTSMVNAKIETDPRLNMFEWSNKSQKALLDNIRYAIAASDRKYDKSIENPAQLDSAAEVPAVDAHIITTGEHEHKTIENDSVHFDRAAEVPADNHWRKPNQSIVDQPVRKSCDLKRRRVAFRESEVLLLWDCLGDELINTDKPIVKAVAEKLILSISKLRPLVDKFGMKSLLIKIRTERDKR